jgi:hypothetical protein
MTYWAAGIIGGATLIGSAYSAYEQRKAQEDANRQNVALSEGQTEEEARQFDLTRQDIQDRYSFEVGRAYKLANARAI